ncbi:MAG: endonuclease/exonuclease/phosphatase family protein [Myxococcales bacterium]|nr:endonuclease/exonuclease/phosphatase family protein [Myxococcales bacterium]
MGAFLLLASACSLEAALGVDGDGSAGSSGDAGSDGPGGSGEAGEAGEATTEAMADSSSGEETGTDPDPPPMECVGRRLRVAAFNTQSIEPNGTAGHEALADVIGRIDADIVCLEEVLFYEDDELSTLAQQTGYTRVIQANPPPAIGGDFTNACLGRGPMTVEGSYGGWELSGDPNANDVGRDILVVRADLSEGGEPCGVGVVSLHLKSGQEPLDWFRRQVEVERVAQAVVRYRQAHPGEPIVVMGDLNESIDDPALGHVFTALPEGLPPSYALGSDITFPLTYQPFQTLQALGLQVADATQEDTVGAYATWADLVRLDYVLYDGLEAEGDEVYNACRDNGVDDSPQGNWMPKAGAPLACGVSEQASDHFPVLVDLVIR